MTQPELYELMARFERSGLHSLKLTVPDCSVELVRAEGPACVPGAAPAASAPAPAPAAPEEPVITAPLVGTFYAAPGPDQPPFVRPGDRVEKGQTVCLMEAMKMMSEVSAPCDCVIEAVLKENGQLAGFGEPLLRYRPC